MQRSRDINLTWRFFHNDASQILWCTELCMWHQRNLLWHQRNLFTQTMPLSMGQGCRQGSSYESIRIVIWTLPSDICICQTQSTNTETAMLSKEGCCTNCKLLSSDKLRKRTVWAHFTALNRCPLINIGDRLINCWFYSSHCGSLSTADWSTAHCLMIMMHCLMTMMSSWWLWCTAWWS